MQNDGGTGRTDFAVATGTAAPSAPPSHRVLHVGCGPAHPLKLHRIFREGWQEVRLDVDPAVAPDIVADMTDMRTVATASVDAIWSSHNVEHLTATEVPIALAEFKRVLKPTGFALITLPDVQAIITMIAEGRLEETVYVSPAGPIAPIDMLFGFRAALARGNHFMAHRTAFDEAHLGHSLIEAGFAEVRTLKGGNYDLWALALMPAADHLAIDDLLSRNEMPLWV